jgi:hypothetical protein
MNEDKKQLIEETERKMLKPAAHWIRNFAQGTMSWQDDSGFFIGFTKQPTLRQRLVRCWVVVRFILSRGRRS